MSSPSTDIPQGLAAPVDSPDSVEVEPDAALEEARRSIDQAPEEEAPASTSTDKVDVIDTLVPKAEPRNWTIRTTAKDRSGEEQVIENTYTQRPLLYFPKMEFFGLVGEAIEKAMAANEGTSINSLLSGPNLRDPSALTLSDFSDAEQFLAVVGKLLNYMPDFLAKSYCIWLDVPDNQRVWAMEALKQTLTDDEGIEIIEIFIDQNWDAIEDFFRVKIGSLRDRVQARREQGSESQQ
jgi:hypothetical protein